MKTTLAIGAFAAVMGLASSASAQEHTFRLHHLLGAQAPAQT